MGIPPGASLKSNLGETISRDEFKEFVKRESEMSRPVKVLLLPPGEKTTSLHRSVFKPGLVVLTSLELTSEKLLGRDNDAVKKYQDALEECQRLAKADPSDDQRQVDLWFAYGDLGETYRTLDRLDAVSYTHLTLPTKRIV